ncbi:hypothetical protein PR202_gb19677 [Eleusine coracana subsp. coracana]|uniref:Uncharacterized protein n=1 Tax=Eleusine coracana subsp. coracana TaxID=191504 RepID=A0AAV5F8P0_ELECO|nr:hypothetical protein PR202_gb19677 [Eleusine coracana subsp. coracana]
MDMAHERDASSEEEVMAGELRRGPWTVEEDLLLVNYVHTHGEGRWNSLARSAGGIAIHIAQHLPGRTDNEIKNYWRTRVQKHAKQLKCDVNSQQFKDVMRYLWMPRLVERIQAAAGDAQQQLAADTPLSSSWQNDGLYASPEEELPAADACWPAEYCPEHPSGGQMVATPAVPELSSTTAGSSSPSMDSGAGAQAWPAPVGGADWFTTACDASSAAAMPVRGMDLMSTQQQQQPCLVGDTWTSDEFPELGVADFEIGSFDVESIWSMDDSLWYTTTQAQGV